MKSVQRTIPLAPYIGGKSRLASTVIRCIDAIEHQTYCEPFIGMGGVFFRRTKIPKAEVINDLNGEVSNLFRIAREHYDAFVDMIKWQLTSREDFVRLMDTKQEYLTDLQRAARFLFLQKLAFGGKVSGKSFGADPYSPARYNVTKMIPLLYAVHERLSRVVIENLDYKAFIQKYDRSKTLFYLDPPYFGNESDYGHGLFSQDEFTVMADLLAAIQGRFILSLNDKPEVREIFKKFHLLPVSTTYTIAKTGNGQKVKELLISNHKLC